MLRRHAQLTALGILVLHSAGCQSRTVCQKRVIAVIRAALQVWLTSPGPHNPPAMPSPRG